jgi:hypothetical protein
MICYEFTEILLGDQAAEITVTFGAATRPAGL